MTMTLANIPEGFKQVSKDEFFEALKADKRDIMPHATNPYHTVWETNNRLVWGWTSPGWKNPSEHERIYALKVH